MARFLPLLLALQLTAVAFLWGGTWVAARTAVADAPPLTVASWRFFLASVALGALLWLREGFPRWSLVEWWSMTKLGLTGIILYNLCFLYGLQHIEAGRGALVVALTPVAISMADQFSGNRRFAIKGWGGVFLAFFGCLWVVTRGNHRGLIDGSVGIGELLILGCVVLWSIYTFTGRKITLHHSALSMTFGASLTGWLGLTLMAILRGEWLEIGRLQWNSSLAIVFLGLFGTALAFTWFADAVARIGPSRAGMFINLVPVFAVLLGSVLLNEPIPPSVLGGGALILIGVIITNRTDAYLKTG